MKFLIFIIMFSGCSVAFAEAITLKCELTRKSGADMVTMVKVDYDTDTVYVEGMGTKFTRDGNVCEDEYDYDYMCHLTRLDDDMIEFEMFNENGTVMRGGYIDRRTGEYNRHAVGNRAIADRPGICTRIIGNKF